MDPKRSLTQILTDPGRTKLQDAWNSTQAAPDVRLLPPGEYTAHIVAGDWETSRSGTLGYKLTFSVLEGDYAGRYFWQDIWLTEAAMPMAKRDLTKLGISDLSQLDQPLPQGIRVKAKVVIHKSDSGTEYNRVKSFDVIGIDKPEPDPFAPDATMPAPTTNANTADVQQEMFPVNPAERTGLPDVS